MPLHDRQRVLRGENGFIRQHGYRAVRRHEGESFQVGGLHRLLHQLDSELLPFHLLQNPHRLLRRPGLIGVDPDPDVPPRRLPDGRKTRDIEGWLDADLHLQRAVAPADRVLRILRHFVRIIDADGDVCLDFAS